jgi:ribosome-associated translation inhibitor RaiA
MQTPLKISFHGIEPSEALEARVRDHAEYLEHLCDRITSCQVVIDAPHRHSHKGQLYEARIQMRIPGHEIVVNREGPHDHAHEDPYVALRDAFSAAERKLEHIMALWERSSQREALAAGKDVRS